MTDDTRLNELLDRWEDLHERGTAPPLEQLCGDSPDLLEELRRRIADLGHIDALLGIGNGSPADALATEREASTSPPTILPAISPYRDLQFHARGGLGEVYRARDEGLNRTVAVKIIQTRAAGSVEGCRRFERESAITGRLEHPGVAPVHASGRCDDGRPYYVMRFIDGETLGDAVHGYHDADMPSSDPGERAIAFRGLLNRFIQVCNTIDYAHGRGVVHRDIKPSNVMLGPYGETLVVDWGLAKLVEDRGEDSAAPSGTESPHLTAAGSAIGTPAFMAPEQFASESDKVGRASDVYSLGATLYCILTGGAPFVGDEFPSIQDRVRRGEFPRPREVRRDVPPALEAICLKAMALDPDDRYTSARLLAADVEKWLADEAVSAWREPMSIRGRRWIRRHRPLVASTVAVVVFGVLSLVGFTVVLTGKNRELDDRGQAAVESQRLASEGEAKAKKSEGDTKATLEFFQNKVLAAARPRDRGGLGRDVQLRAALDAAESEIEQSFPDQPAVEAAIRDTLGESYRHLGESAKAIRQHERALALNRRSRGPEHITTLNSMDNLAVAHEDAGQFDRAFPLYEKVLQAVRIELGEEDPSTLNSMHKLAICYEKMGHHDRAIPLHERAIEVQRAKLGRDHFDTLIAMKNLAMAYRKAGQVDRAIPLFEEVVEALRAKLGEDHLDTVTSTNSLALAYHKAGRFDRAIPLHERVLAVLQAKLGEDHPNTLSSMNNLAMSYGNTDKLDRAIAIHKQVLQRRRLKLAENHPDTLASLNNLAVVYQIAGQIDRAIPLFEETIKAKRAKLGENHPDTLASIYNLAVAYQDAGQLDRAISLHELALASRRATMGEDHPDTLLSQINLARAELVGNPARAELLLRNALETRVKQSPDDWVTFETRSLLGGSLLLESKYAEAEPFLLKGFEGMKSAEAKIPAPYKKRLTEAGQRIVDLYVAWGKKDKAQEWRKRLPERIRGQDLPANPFAPP